MKKLNEYETPITDISTIWGRTCLDSHIYIPVNRARDLERKLAMCRDALAHCNRYMAGVMEWEAGISNKDNQTCSEVADYALDQTK